MTTNNRIGCILFLLMAICLGRVPSCYAQDTRVSSGLSFESTDKALMQAFNWAKSQALSYAHPESESIGAWYEAALPGRDAFCMRDVSHQTTGAAALGLYSANHNMLQRFAASIAAERDWAGYWEIDRAGRASAADYVNDNDFWYNLPANFDLLSAVVRMWRWTGDESYLTDRDFERLFQTTATSYISAWQLQPDRVQSRPRLMNRHLQSGRFVDSRGIPSYTEGRKDFNVGTDLLAAEYRALLSLEEITVERHRGRDFRHLQITAAAVQKLIEENAWSEKERHFHGFFSEGGDTFGSGDSMVLYFDAARNPAHLRGALDHVAAPAYWQQVNIEEESYLPLTLYRYGRSTAAYSILMDLSNSEKKRREYPEVSYSVIAGIVSGVMGLQPSETAANATVQTLSQLGHSTDIAELKGVAIKNNVVDVRDVGTSSTSLTNQAGPPLLWRASFMGAVTRLKVDGKWMRAQHSRLPGGMTNSWVIVTVRPGTTSEVTRSLH
jgi:hypothetical protein